MRVGFKTQTETQFQSITIPDMDISPVLVSVVQGKDNNMDNKFLVWHIEGGLGKNIAATALLPELAKQYKTRKIVVVASYPEVFLNHPDVYRVYRVGMTAYFYEDYILNKDTLVFRHEPYFQTGHILKQKHLVQNWAELLGVSYKKQLPNLHFNQTKYFLDVEEFKSKEGVNGLTGGIKGKRRSKKDVLMESIEKQVGVEG